MKVCEKWTPVCATIDIPERGARVIRRAGCDDIAVFRNGQGEVYAIVDNDARATDRAQRNAARPFLLFPVIMFLGHDSRRCLAPPGHGHADDNTSFYSQLRPFNGLTGGRGKQQQDGTDQFIPLWKRDGSERWLNNR